MSVLDRLSEIRARLAAAGLSRPLRIDQQYYPRTTASFWVRIVEPSEDGLSLQEVVRTIPTEARWAEQQRRQCELLANAPEDLAFLLEENRRLRAAHELVRSPRGLVRQREFRLTAGSDGRATVLCCWCGWKVHRRKVYDLAETHNCPGVETAAERDIRRGTDLPAYGEVRS